MDETNFHALWGKKRGVRGQGCVLFPGGGFINRAFYHLQKRVWGGRGLGPLQGKTLTGPLLTVRTTAGTQHSTNTNRDFSQLLLIFKKLNYCFFRKMLLFSFSFSFMFSGNSELVSWVSYQLGGLYVRYNLQLAGHFCNLWCGCLEYSILIGQL